MTIAVPAGSRLGVVGHTGSGKTTLGYLIARLYDAGEGAVKIDGVDVRDLSFDSLAATVGVVSQETYLLHASIRENLRFAKPEATDDEIESAARAATVRDADQIVVLDHGRVVQHGTHDELLARDGRYAELVARDRAPELELQAA